MPTGQDSSSILRSSCAIFQKTLASTHPLIPPSITHTHWWYNFQNWQKTASSHWKSSWSDTLPCQHCLSTSEKSILALKLSLDPNRLHFRRPLSWQLGHPHQWYFLVSSLMITPTSVLLVGLLPSGYVKLLCSAFLLPSSPHCLWPCQSFKGGDSQLKQCLPQGCKHPGSISSVSCDNGYL